MRITFIDLQSISYSTAKSRLVSWEYDAGKKVQYYSEFLVSHVKGQKHRQTWKQKQNQNADKNDESSYRMVIKI